MATYKFDVYIAASDTGSIVHYGPPLGGGSFFVVDSFTVHEQGYGTVRLDWSTPSSTITWSRMRIIRSSSGYPVNETDGVVVVEIDSESSTRTAYDVGLVPGSYYYYSLFAETDLPSYNNTHTYTRGEIVKDIDDNAYVSLTVGNMNNALTDTTVWSPVNNAKQWLLVADTQLLVTKRYDSTTTMYTLLPRAYRDPEQPDWVEPVQPPQPDLNYYSQWPDLARYLSTFGFTTDGIRTYYESLLDITDPEAVPVDFLPVLAQHMGVTLYPATSARLQRLRLANAPLLDRGRGTEATLVSAINATFNWDAEVTVGGNLMPSADTSDAMSPVYPTWDPAAHYTTGEYVRFSTSVGVYQALVDSTNVTPVIDETNETWEYGTDVPLPAPGPLYEQESGSQANWAPEDRTVAEVGVAVGVEDPANSGSTNAFYALNISGAVAGSIVTAASNFYAPDWADDTAFRTGDLALHDAMIWQALVDNTDVTPGTDVTIWRLYLDRVPATTDPSRIFEDAIPVTPGVDYTMSVYVRCDPATDVAAMIGWYDAAGSRVLSSIGGTSTVVVGTFTRYDVTDTAGVDAAYAVPEISFDPLPDAPNVALWKSVMFEAASSPSTYEGARQVKIFITPDDVYRDFPQKRYLVEDVIRDFVPLGTTWTVTYAE